MDEMAQSVCAAGCTMRERHSGDTRPVEKALDPCFDRDIELDPPGIDQKRDFPSCDGAQIYRSATLPAAVDQAPRTVGEMPIAAVEPKRDVGVKQQAFRHRSNSAPVS